MGVRASVAILQIRLAITLIALQKRILYIRGVPVKRARDFKRASRPLC
jgi:hypothetical protein